jgi:hypothetical protein
MKFMEVLSIAGTGVTSRSSTLDQYALSLT